ncbi:hypothetical protein KC315_g15005 [Hortaea werneckii]|nr:hypothetical protein KC315_g15005 [Hortaea werneckii]
MLPTRPITAASDSHAPPPHTGSESRHEISNREDLPSSRLLLWTGDGRIGVLGYGQQDPLHAEASQQQQREDVETTTTMTAEAVEQRARADAERQYGMAMRRALERNADEVRFVRGLGMGFLRP